MNICKKLKISQVGTDVGYHCVKSLRADLRNEEMRMLRVKDFIELQVKGFIFRGS